MQFNASVDSNTSATHDTISLPRHCRGNACETGKLQQCWKLELLLNGPLESLWVPLCESGVWDSQLFHAFLLSYAHAPSLALASEWKRLLRSDKWYTHGSQDTQEPCILGYSCPSGKRKPTDCCKLQEYTHSFIGQPDYRIRTPHPQDNRDPWK